jgi:hypothetical protein
MWLTYGGLGVGRRVLSTIDDIQALKIKMAFFNYNLSTFLRTHGQCLIIRLMLFYSVAFLIPLFNARVDKKHGDGKLSAKMGPF